MFVSYNSLLQKGRNLARVHITTEHPLSYHEMPVIVHEDGTVVDWLSWIGLDYQVEKLEYEEKRMILDRILADEKDRILLDRTMLDRILENMLDRILENEEDRMLLEKMLDSKKVR